MSDSNLLLKKLTVLTNKKIWVSDDVDVHLLYIDDNLKLIKGEVKDFRSTIELTNEYLTHKRKVFTGLPEQSYTNNWCTYQRCTTIQLCFDGNLLKILIQVFDGDFCNGDPTNLRWKGEFEVNQKCLDIFEKYIEYAFNNEIDRQFLYEEEKRIEKRKKAIRRKLLL